MSFHYDIDLLTSPLPVISLCGLLSYHVLLKDYINKYNIVSFPYDYKYSVSKNKKDEDLDSYRPKGIIKSNWLEKHGHLPSLNCILYEYDNTDWSVQECAIIGLYNTFINNNNTRENIKNVLVILYNNDIFDDEKYNKLYKSLNLISSKYIYLLNIADIKNSIKKLDYILYELSIDYYRNIIKRLKKLQNRFNKMLQPALCVRHLFKIGYYSEVIKEDDWGKYYKEAYDVLRFIPHSSHSLPECQAIAYILNFKYIRWLLNITLGPNNEYSGSVTRLQESVDQFTAHIGFWREKAPFPQLAFWQSFWMTKQYTKMAEFIDILSKRISDTAMVSNRQFHSGFYYSSAAKSLLQYDLLLTSTYKWLQSQPNVSLDNVQPSTTAYIGQLFPDFSLPDQNYIPVQFDNLFAYSLAQNKIIELVLTSMQLKVDENGTDKKHIFTAIDMYLKSYNTYRKLGTSNTLRITLHLASLLAVLYIRTDNHSHAKKFLDSVNKTYRLERWWAILTAHLKLSLDCASKLNLVDDKICYLLELMSNQIISIDQEKHGFQELFLQTLNNSTSLCTIDIDEINRGGRLFKFTGMFKKTTYFPDTSIDFIFDLKSEIYLPLNISKLEVLFNPESNLGWTIIHDLSRSDTVENITEGKKLFTTYADLTNGFSSKLSKRLSFTYPKIFTISFTGLVIFLNSSINDNLILQMSPPMFTTQSLLSTVNIISRPPMEWNIHSLSPGFTREHFPLILQITQSNYDVPIVKNVILKFKLSDEDILKNTKLLFQSDSLNINSEMEIANWADKSWSLVPTELNLPNIPAGSSYYIPLCLYHEMPAKVAVSFSLYWNDGDVPCFVESNFIVQFISPFKYNARYFSSKIPDHGDKTVDNASLLCCSDAHIALELENLAKHSLNLDKISLIKTEGSDDSELLLDEERNIGPLGRYSTIAKIKPSITGKVSIGKFNVRFSRKVSSSIIYGKEFNDLISSLPVSIWDEVLAPINIENVLFDVNYDFPSSIEVSSRLTFKVSIQNNSDFIQDITVKVGESSYFVVSGPCNNHFKIASKGVFIFDFGLLPLQSGHIALPSILIETKTTKLLNTSNLGMIFVYPRERKSVKIN